MNAEQIQAERERVQALLWGERDEVALISGDLYRLQHADPATITDPHDLYETAPGTTILCGPHADLGGAAPYLPLVLAAPTLARQVVELAEEVERLRGLLTRVLPISIPGGTLCRMCHQRLSPTRPHGPDCPVPAIEAALATQEAQP